MLKEVMTASALAGALLMMAAASPAQAVPLVKPEVSKPDGVTLVGEKGGRGGGFAFRPGGGGGGPKAGGFSGGGPRIGRGGGGDGGRGLSRRGGGGPRLGGFSGGGPRLGRGGGGGGRALSRRGDGPKFGGFSRGGPRLGKRDGGPRYSDRTERSFKGDSGRRFKRDFKHRRFSRKDRRFRGFVFYGPPAVYGYYNDDYCEWLYRRAAATGSPYWWDRYYGCLDAYYY